MRWIIDAELETVWEMPTLFINIHLTSKNQGHYP